MTDTKFEVILRMLFLNLSNADVSFGERTLTWRTYTTNKALPITKQNQIINKNDFVIVALDADGEIFIVHMVIKERKEILMHFKRQT